MEIVAADLMSAPVPGAARPRRRTHAAVSPRIPIFSPRAHGPLFLHPLPTDTRTPPRSLSLSLAFTPTAWEACKENAQPIKRGRNANALSERLEKGVAPLDEDAAKRAEFEARVEAESAGADPLDAWRAYIKWQEDTYVTGGGANKVQVLPLLERCAFALKDDARYQNDIKYLRIWIAYAEGVRDAEPIFEYLFDRQIGVLHALFWAAWALVLEQKRKYAEADKLFVRGALMRAQPAAYLEQLHHNFQARTAMKSIKQMAEGGGAGGAAGGASAEPSRQKERKTLNRLTKKEAAGSSRPTKQRSAAPLAASSARPAGDGGVCVVLPPVVVAPPRASATS